VFHSDRNYILYRLKNTAIYWLKIAIVFKPTSIYRHSVIPSNYHLSIRFEKNDIVTRNVFKPIIFGVQNPEEI